MSIKPQRTIAITAGHSEVDPGAVSGKLKEANLATLIRDKLSAKLKDTTDITVLTDGAPGRNQPLKDAIRLCKLVGGRGVEIHFNAAENRSATGIEALAHSGSRVKCQQLCAVINKVTGLPLRGGDGGYKASDSGQHAKLGYCEAGGIVLEVGFISNDKDVNAIMNNMDTLIEKLAGVINSWE